MQLRRVAAGLALAGLVVAGCGRGGSEGQGGGSAEPAAPAGQATTGGAKGGGPAGRDAAAGQAGGVRLADLGNRIVRTASVDLEVGKGSLGATISRATDVVTRSKGIYVGSSTSVPDGGPARGEVTFRVPVPAFEPTLRELKGLGTYRGERSSTEDVTNQYVDLRGQLTAWRAQERVYLRLLSRAKSVGDVIAVQNQLREVQTNIERLQGQVDYLEDQSSFSTIALQLTEPGAGPAARPEGRLAKAWATALNGLSAMGVTALVALVWLLPVAAAGLLVVVLVRTARRLRPRAAAPSPEPPAA